MVSLKSGRGRGEKILLDNGKSAFEIVIRLFCVTDIDYPGFRVQKYLIDFPFMIVLSCYKLLLNFEIRLSR